MIYQFKITLQGVQPEIWRELQVESDMGMDELHYIVQTAMYWSGQFNFTFEIGGKVYGEPEEDEVETMEEAADYAISEVFKAVGDKAQYSYEDGWELTVELTGTSEPKADVTYPFCTGGARNSPLEECGGPEGYATFLVAINDPKNPDREELLEAAGGEFDPEGFDPEDVNEEFTDPENWEDFEDEEDEDDEA